MQFLLGYLLKLSISLSVVYLFYFGVLRLLTFYNWNRWYFLLFNATCFVIPFINITYFWGSNEMENSSILTAIPSINLYSNLHTIDKTLPTGYSLINKVGSVLPFILIVGTIIFLIRLAMQYLSFTRLKRKAVLISDSGIKIYSVEKNIIPFSIGNSIFVHVDVNNNVGLNEIIRHEFVHVKQKHTIDILFTEILCVFNWYNPFAWLIRRSVRQNLEFIADNSVLQHGFDKREYQYLLLKVIGVSKFSIAQQFNFSSLKKRIIMMNTTKSARLNVVRFLFVLPLVAALLLAFRETNTMVPQPFHTSVIVSNKSTDTLPHKLPANVKSIQINNSAATVRLRNGRIERYNIDNESEMIAFTKLYGALPLPPPPPIPPIAPMAPVPPNATESFEPIAPVPPMPPVPPVPPVPKEA
jgi:beta-lactamase regulating signal transducer with metallopeptidase domain